MWNYERERGQLVNPYNKAMGSQWNSVTDLDWSIASTLSAWWPSKTPRSYAVAKVAATLAGSPLAH